MPNTDDYVGVVISDVARLLRTAFDRRVRELGITRAHLDDAARHLAGDLRNVGLHESVLGRRVTPAREPEHERARHHEQRHADQREWAQGSH